MNRRDFLKRAAVGGAGLALTPHAALHHVQALPPAWGPALAEAQAKVALQFIWAIKRMYAIDGG